MSGRDVVLSLSSAALILALTFGLDAASAAPPSMSPLIHVDHLFDLRAMPDADANVTGLADFRFAPASFAVAACTALSEPYTIASNDGFFQSGWLNQNDLFTFNFGNPDACNLLCSIHPQMKSTTTVN